MNSTSAAQIPLPVRSRAADPAEELKGGLPVQAGSILIDLGSDPPGSLLVESRDLPGGWGLMENPASVIDGEAGDAGWSLFFLAGEIRVSGAGFSRRDAMQAALNRLTRKVKSRDCNSFEVAGITEGSFLGVSRVGISGHIRHLQKGRLLLGE